MEVVLVSLFVKRRLWLCGFEPYPSSVRLIFIWLSVISLSVEVIEFVGLCLASSKRLYLWREELCTLKLYPQWRFSV